MDLFNRHNNNLINIGFLLLLLSDSIFIYLLCAKYCSIYCRNFGEVTTQQKKASLVHNYGYMNLLNEISRNGKAIMTKLDS